MKKLKLEELNRLSLTEFKQAPKIPVVVILDQIRSMHNVGSVFRTADAFGIKKLYLCGITPRPPHREIQKTAIGAQDSVDWEYVANSSELVDKLKVKGYQIIIAEQTDESVQLDQLTINSQLAYALVLGHEVDGVSQEVVDKADIAVEIPQFGTKHSLNVSVAAGITMYTITSALRKANT